MKEGNAAAFEVLYNRYSALVYSFALKACESKELAAEITQDVFVRLWTTTAVYRPELSQFPTWLLTIARGIYRDKLKSASKSAKVVTLYDTAEWEHGATSASQRTVTRNWFREDVYSVLLNMNRQEKLIIELAYFQGLTLSEIANQLEQPLGTVKTRLHRALKRLRKSMVEWEGGLEQ
ncbi:RNA polymerase sigma factor [Alicyclobacillus sp. SO9]|nr:RNA polymerase sigma factor [Alicyclobacillus sp. SO9]